MAMAWLHSMPDPCRPASVIRSNGDLQGSNRARKREEQQDHKTSVKGDVNGAIPHGRLSSCLQDVDSDVIKQCRAAAGKDQGPAYDCSQGNVTKLDLRALYGTRFAVQMSLRRLSCR